MTKSTRIFLFCICLVTSVVVQACKSPTTVETFNTDMFPLKNGHQYTYSYSTLSSTQNGKWIDSGTVAYLIKDSSDISIALRAWVITEEVNLVHRYYFLTDQFGGVRLDSSYLVQGTSTDTLKESLVGSHSLTAQFLIWRFPLPSADPPTMNFNRYSSSPDSSLTLFDIVQPGPSTAVGGFQTSKQAQYVFHKDIGLTSSSYGQSTSSDVQYSIFILHAALLTFSGN